MKIRSQAFTAQPRGPAAVVHTAQKRSHPGRSGKQAPQHGASGASLSFAQMLSGDDIRANLIRALESQIADGTYQVSAQDVASALLSSMTGDD